MRSVIIALSMLLTGCATSGVGLSASALDLTLTSSKSPREWAICSIESFSGAHQMRDDGTNWWIIVVNGYGAPLARWDFKPTAEGSIAELRSPLGTGTGRKMVEACA